MFTFIVILRRRTHEHSPSRTFIRLFTLPYRKQGKAGDWVSEVQSVLCEDTVCLKRIIVVWSSPFQRSDQQYFGDCYDLWGITKKSNCCCTHQVVNSGTYNWANKKIILIKTKHKFIFILFAIKDLIFYTFLKSKHVAIYLSGVAHS